MSAQSRVIHYYFYYFKMHARLIRKKKKILSQFLHPRHPLNRSIPLLILCIALGKTFRNDYLPTNTRLYYNCNRHAASFVSTMATRFSMRENTSPPRGEGERGGGQLVGSATKPSFPVSRRGMGTVARRINGLIKHAILPVM